MRLEEALAFLRPALTATGVPQRWADLGCGSGLFTQALTSLLPAGSFVYAVDKQKNFSAKAAGSGASPSFHQADFITDELPLQNLDGILMGNALHYVADKKAFVEKCKAYLKGPGIWVVIEYDTAQANPWVPYPINFKNLERLFIAAGYTQISKAAERPSVYRSGTMYCATVKP